MQLLGEKMDEMTEEAVWVIQHCIDVDEKLYENWPNISDTLMTQTQMAITLEECSAKWPNQMFRGHNIQY